MLEKTSLAETEFNSLYNNDVQKMQAEITQLREKVKELQSQIDWLERQYSKNL
jgi:predicted  nucleic acid-binding Zn-ribbon protein